MIEPSPMPFEFWRISDEIMARMKGRPFCHLGRSIEEGFDCLGTNIYYYKAMGVPLEIPERAKSYPKDFWKNGVEQTYLDEITHQFAIIQESACSKGDMVMFKPDVLSANVGHTGIVADPAKHTFIHAFLRRGVSISCWDDRFWRNRLFAFGRHQHMGSLRARVKDVPIGMRA